MTDDSETVPGRAGRPHETPAERADRNFIEMLGELRVVQTGVQILFGFLLILAVQERFEDPSVRLQAIYLATLLLSAVATAFLMAPVAYHRALFRRGRKPELVDVANRLMVVGMAALFLAISGAVLLVLDLIFTPPLAVPVTLAVAVMFCLLWFVLPWLRAHRRPDHP